MKVDTSLGRSSSGTGTLRLMALIQKESTFNTVIGCRRMRLQVVENLYIV